jgi:Ca-activated chloride channel family protein
VLRRVCVLAGVFVCLFDLRGEAQVFRSTVDLVSLGVTVMDRRGALVTDLTADDFSIVEDGQPQTVRLFAGGKGPGAPEMHLGLLFDSSRSMETEIDFSRRAAIKFLNALPESLDVTLVDFDTEIRVARYGQLDFPRLVERIRRRRPDGMTAMHDAVGVYLDGTSDQTGRKVFVLYTDGLDTSSSMSYGDALDMLRASDVTMYAIGFVGPRNAVASMDQRVRLMRMAEATGGAAFFPQSNEDLDPTYAKVVEEIRAQYTIGYLSTNLSVDGNWRRVEVTTKRPNLKVRCRKGYFAPFRPSR